MTRAYKADLATSLVQDAIQAGQVIGSQCECSHLRIERRRGFADRCNFRGPGSIEAPQYATGRAWIQALGHQHANHARSDTMAGHIDVVKAGMVFVQTETVQGVAGNGRRRQKSPGISASVRLHTLLGQQRTLELTGRRDVLVDVVKRCVKAGVTVLQRRL